MAQQVVQPSFASGELGPSLHSRVDLARYHVGAALMSNFFVDYRGGATSRPGTRYVGRARTNTGRLRLIPFQFNTEQTYILEFSPNRMRVLKDAGFVLETSKTCTITVLDTLNVPAHGYVNGDSVVLAGSHVLTAYAGRNEFIVRNAMTNTIQLETFDGVPLGIVLGAVITGVTRIYSIATPYSAADLETLKFVQSADTMTLIHSLHAARHLTRSGHAAWTLSIIQFSTALSPPTLTTITSTAGSGTKTAGYVVTSVAENGEESVASNIGIAVWAPPSTGSPDVTNTLTWTLATGAKYYNVYKSLISNTGVIPKGSQFGYIGSTIGVQFPDNNILPDFTKTPPQQRNPFARRAIISATVTNGGADLNSSLTAIVTDATGSGVFIETVVLSNILQALPVVRSGQEYTAPTLTFGNVAGGTSPTGTLQLGPALGTYPSVATYFQQRAVYAASANAPATYWMSKTGFFRNFDVSDPVVDDDAITGTLTSLEVNAIRWMVPLGDSLIMFTSGSIWRVSASGQNSAFTPSSLSQNTQDYVGIADVQPIVVKNNILAIQEKGAGILDLEFNFYASAFTSLDRSVQSNHFFYGYTIRSWTFAREPYKLAWAVRDDGTMLSFTYLKEQEVFGWAQHHTAGEFDEIASISEGNENAVYLAVRRKIEGIWVRYIERMASREITNAEDAWAVDCALEYPLTRPVATVNASGVAGMITVTASSAVFGSGDVGKVLRTGGGIGVVTAATSTTLTVNMYEPIKAFFISNGVKIAKEAASGKWSLSVPVATVRGLGHLEGQVVKVLADGNVHADKTVLAGVITLDQPASRIVVGLGYQCDLQTLRVDTGTPSIQGKRKKIISADIRVVKSRGLRVGIDPDHLQEIKERPITLPMGQPIQLVTKDHRVVLAGPFEVEGQLWIRQSEPLPGQIVGIVLNMDLGGA